MKETQSGCAPHPPIRSPQEEETAPLLLPAAAVHLRLRLALPLVL